MICVRLGENFVAPNKPTPKTPADCAREAYQNNVVAIGLDVASFVPGESIGAAGVRAGVALGATINSAVRQDAAGSLLAIGSFQLEPLAQAAKYAGVGFAESIPVIGTIVSGVATANDLYGAYKDYENCLMPGPG